MIPTGVVVARGRRVGRGRGVVASASGNKKGGHEKRGPSGEGHGTGVLDHGESTTEDGQHPRNDPRPARGQPGGTSGVRGTSGAGPDPGAGPGHVDVPWQSAPQGRRTTRSRSWSELRHTVGTGSYSYPKPVNSSALVCQMAAPRRWSRPGRRDQHVVEAPGLPLEDIAVGAFVPRQREGIRPPPVLEEADRVLPSVAVQVPGQDRVPGPEACRVRRHPVGQRGRRGHPVGIPAGLTVALVEVPGRGPRVPSSGHPPLDLRWLATTSQGAPARPREGLAQGRAAPPPEDQVVRPDRGSHRGDPALPVEQPHADRIGPRSLGHLHGPPVPGGPGGVERVHELAEGGERAGAVVLHLREGHHVGIHRLERRHELGLLKLVELRRLRAPGGGKPAAPAVAVEEVLHVQDRDAEEARLRPSGGATSGASGRGACRRISSGATGRKR
jgi:hypothetical protein